MIVASLNGRLGNWLFQYAAARSLALDRNSGVALDASRFASWRHPFAGHVVRALRFFSLDAAFTRSRDTLPEFAEQDWGYDPQLHALGSDTRLRGYFQSPHYWRGHEGQIKADLAPVRLPRDAPFESLLADIERSASVALHVRRGDYLTIERGLHHVCSDDYYERAVRFVRERVSFAALYVFSDDPAWCRSRYAERAPAATVVDLAASRAEPGLDLYLMSRCKHHIISNSTYSWWGAWLAAAPGQIVCTPSRWFNDEAMSAVAMRDTVPAAWHRIACDEAVQTV